MKKSITFLAVILISFAFVFSINSFVYAADVIKLKAANYLPTTHPMSTLTGWFSEEIKKRTNGRVEITYYDGGTLLNPVKMYDGVVTGIADIGVSHIDYTRGRFPVMEVFDLPLGFTSGWVASQTSNDFFNKFKPAEWNDVNVLYVNTSGPLILECVKKPVKTLKDIKGLKIRAVGVMSEVITALGGLPMPLQMPDVYDSLLRGVIDGVTVDLSTLKFWKFAEVIKYVTLDWQLGTGYTFYCVMNKAKWNALPPDIQKIFTEVASEAREKQAALWNAMDIEGMDAFKKAGGKSILLSNAEAAKWVKAVEPVLAGYKKTMVSKGYKEAEINEWLKYIKERIGYWKKEEKKRGIASPF
jgi:TRAP-type C4-dicarboxylate transport system substrate-binding protein